jgi:hypothetical protein
MKLNDSLSSMSISANRSPTSYRVLSELWHTVGPDPSALSNVTLSGSDPVVPSSFAIGTAAQTSIAAAALAACGFAHIQGARRQHINVDMVHAALECAGWFSVDGHSPALFDELSGLYRCRDDDGFSVSAPSVEDYLDTCESGFGQLRSLRHAAYLSHRPVSWTRPSMPPGSHPPAWPEG